MGEFVESEDLCHSIKYLHFFLHSSIGWARIILNMINMPENKFDITEHLFITSKENVYKEFKDTYNIIYRKSAPGMKGVDLINKYAEYGDVIIVHSFSGPRTAVKVERKFRDKIVWRTWGHDVRLHYRDGFPKDIKNFLTNMEWRRAVGEFCAVGHGGVVDEVNIERFFGKKIKCVYMPYRRPGQYEDLCKVRDRVIEKDDTIRVCVGHSGFINDNHIEIIRRLKKYENENMELCFVLTYGSKQYIDKIIKEIPRTWKGHYRIILDHMAFEEYALFIKKSDIIILDGEDSYALGNLSMALFFGKKLYLNKKGVLARAMQKEGLPYAQTSQIGKMSFEEFSKRLNYEVKKHSLFYNRPDNEYVDIWKESLNTISNIINGRKE